MVLIGLYCPSTMKYTINGLFLVLVCSYMCMVCENALSLSLQSSRRSIGGANIRRNDQSFQANFGLSNLKKILKQDYARRPKQKISLLYRKFHNAMSNAPCNVLYLSVRDFTVLLHDR
jgi:hypothetical protein